MTDDCAQEGGTPPVSYEEGARQCGTRWADWILLVVAAVSVLVIVFAAPNGVMP